LRRYDKVTFTYLHSSYCCLQCIDFLFLSFSFHFSLDPRRQQLAPKREHVQFWDRHNDHASVSSVLSQAHTHAHAHTHTPALTLRYTHTHTHTHTCSDTEVDCWTVSVGLFLRAHREVEHLAREEAAKHCSLLHNLLDRTDITH